MYLQFRHYRAWVGQEMVGGPLSMQRVESGLTSKRWGGINCLCAGWDFPNGGHKKNRRVGNRSRRLFIEEIISLAVSKLLMTANRRLGGPGILHDSV